MSVFFFKQKAAYEMRISDWSSDVCSSDLRAVPRAPTGRGAPGPRRDAPWKTGPSGACLPLLRKLHPLERRMHQLAALDVDAAHQRRIAAPVADGGDLVHPRQARRADRLRRGLRHRRSEERRYGEEGVRKWATRWA